MLELPEGVAFKVGKDTSISYMVLQIHYGHVDRFKGETDQNCKSDLYMNNNYPC